MALHHDIAERLRNIAGLVGRHSPNAPKIEVNGVYVSAGIEQTVAEAALNTAADKLQAGTASISAVGAVCRGKTTVLNSLVGMELLPTGMDANTGGICKVEFGNNPDSVTLVMDDDSTRTVTRKEFETFINLPQNVSVTDEPVLPDELTRLRYARLECDSPLLERGVTLVDTLGFNAVNGKVQAATTRQFLREASAVMLVLKTVSLVEQTDLDILNACYYQTSKGTENMFIVINELMKGLSDEDRKELVEKRAPAQLGAFFVDDNGEFDSARFRERVFLVDPKAASESDTGIPELEQALLRYVDKGIAMDVEVESAVRQVLLPALRQVDNSIREQLAGYRVSHEEFEVHQKETMLQLQALRDDTTDLHENIIRKGLHIADAAVHHFQMFFTQRFGDRNSAWLSDWQKVAPEVRAILGLSFRGIPKALMLLFSAKRRETASRELQGTLQRLLLKQIEAWKDAIAKALKPEINELSEMLGDRIAKFALDVDALETALSKRAAQGVDDAVTGAPGSKTRIAQGSKLRIAQGLATILGVATVDTNQITGGLTNPSYEAMMARLLTNAIVNRAVAPLFAMGFVGWMVALLFIALEFLGVHVFDSRWAANQIGIGKEILKTLSADEVHDTIRGEVEKQVEEVAARVRKLMREETIALEQEIVRVALVRSADGSDKEVARLETISALVEEEFGEISRLVFGRVLTPEERKELERSVSGVKGGENAD